MLNDHFDGIGEQHTLRRELHLGMEDEDVIGSHHPYGDTDFQGGFPKAPGAIGVGANYDSYGFGEPMLQGQGIKYQEGFLTDL